MDLAHSVADQDQRLGKSARIKGAGHMSQMMIHGHELFCPTIRWIELLQIALLHIRTEDLGVLLFAVVAFRKIVPELLVRRNRAPQNPLPMP